MPANRLRIIVARSLALIMMAFLIPVLGPGTDSLKLSRLKKALREPDATMPYVAAEKLGRSGSRKAVAALLSAMEEERASIRSVAAFGLGYAADRRVPTALLKALVESPTVGYYAARSLARIRDPRTLEPLLVLVRDGKPEIRLNAVYALYTWRDPRIFDALCSALEDPADSVRRATVRGIALSGDERTIAVLSLAMLGDAAISGTAAESLALLPDEQGIPALAEAFISANPKLDVALSRAFYLLSGADVFSARLMNVFRSALDSGPTRLRRSAAIWLGLFGDSRSVDALIRATKDPDLLLGSAAMVALSQIRGDRADAAIIACAQNEAASLHRVCAQAVCQWNDSETLLPVLHLLSDKNENVRYYAAARLNLHPDARAIRALAAAARMKNAPHIHVQILFALAKALSKTDEARATEVLQSILQLRGAENVAGVASIVAGMRSTRAIEALPKEFTQRWDVRYAILQSLAQAPNPLMEKAILEGLRDNDSEMRAAAAASLGNVRTPAAVNLLIGALDDPAFSVWSSAVKSLAQIRGKHAVPLFVKSRRWLPRLIKDLEDRSSRSTAVETLGSIGDRDAVRALLDILHSTGSADPICCAEYALSETKAAAAKALGLIGDTQAVPALVRALGMVSANVSRASAEALGELGDPRSVRPLIEALEHEHCAVRISAARALGNIGDKTAARELAIRLSNFCIRTEISDALQKLGWQPTNDRDRLYFMLARSEWNGIAADWRPNQGILVRDLDSHQPETALMAAAALIAMGSEETVEPLASSLIRQGTEEMARIFYNCRHPRLRNAAVHWALKEGRDFRELNSEEMRLRWKSRNFDYLGCPAEEE